jgi:UDP-GlcNAc:undecaprenyl-phosphate GlcNAc-1-phosphate transferase
LVFEGFSAVEEFCAVSALLTAAMCYCAPAFARITQLIDKPDGIRKLHDIDTPLIGGPALLIPSFAVAAFYLVGTHGPLDILVAVAAATLTLIIGMIDDRMGILPVWRLGMLTGVILLVFAVMPSYILHSLWFALFNAGFWIPLGVLAVPITAVVILGFINAVNMADGINGQLLGSIVIWCGFIVYFLGPVEGMPFIAIACSAVVTFIFNLRGHLFSGSSGAYASALFVGLGAIFAYHDARGALPADMILCWFWLPVLDCVRLMVSRALRGRSPLSSDRNHFHHILLKHMRTRYVLVIYLTLLAAPGAMALFNGIWGSITFVLCILCYAALVTPMAWLKSVLPARGAAPAGRFWPTPIAASPAPDKIIKTARAES